MADRAEAAAAAGDRERLRNIFLDAARVLMLFGAVAAVGTPSADPMEAFLGLVLWMLGVCLLSLVPAAGHFPRAAMAITILEHLFTLRN